MASAFAETILSNMLASAVPNHDAAIQAKAVDAFIETQRDQSVVAKAQAFEKVAALLAQATADNMPSAVTSGYEKLLAQLTS